jgi:hypothetical protein
MAGTRTTVVLDPRSRGAAKALSRALGITPSEVMRRALIHFEEHVCGVTAAEIARRRQEFSKLMELMDGTDAESEVRRLKKEDEFF